MKKYEYIVRTYDVKDFHEMSDDTISTFLDREFGECGFCLSNVILNNEKYKFFFFKEVEDEYTKEVIKNH